MKAYRDSLGNPELRSAFIESCLHALENPDITSGTKRWLESNLLELGYGDEPNIYQGAEKQ